MSARYRLSRFAIPSRSINKDQYVDTNFCPFDLPNYTEFALLAAILPALSSFVKLQIMLHMTKLLPLISTCYPGHSLEREEEYPNADQCLPCDIGTYRLEKAFINSTKPHCVPCDAKVYATEDHVLPTS